MDVLVVTPHYLPDGGPGAALYALLCEELVRRAHSVSVVCAVPHYPSGRVPSEFRGVAVRREVRNGVRVVRVPLLSINRTKLPLRFLQFFMFQFGATVVGLKERFDVLLASNPGLQVGLPFVTLTGVKHKPAIFNVHDVYPDSGSTSAFSEVGS